MSVPLVKKNKVDHQTLFFPNDVVGATRWEMTTLSTLPVLQYIVIQPFFMVSYEGADKNQQKCIAFLFL